jgi:hypothetical protein
MSSSFSGCGGCAAVAAKMCHAMLTRLGARPLDQDSSVQKSTILPGLALMPIAPSGLTAQGWCTLVRGNSTKKPPKTCTSTLPERYVPQTLRRHKRSNGSRSDGRVETRYSVKWKSLEGRLVLKITDDVTVRVFFSCLAKHRCPISYEMCLE